MDLDVTLARTAVQTGAAATMGTAVLRTSNVVPGEEVVEVLGDLAVLQIRPQPRPRLPPRLSQRRLSRPYQ
jgi:hypothetical protein